MSYHYFWSKEEILALNWETYHREKHNRTAGVYIFIDCNTSEIVYAGKTSNFGGRFYPGKHHAYRPDQHIIKVLPVSDANERNLMEYDLIRLLKPPLNERAGTCPHAAVEQFRAEVYHKIFG